MSDTWKQEPGLLSVVKRLQLLALRLARLEAAERVKRAHAILQATAPRGADE